MGGWEHESQRVTGTLCDLATIRAYFLGVTFTEPLSINGVTYCDFYSENDHNLREALFDIYVPLTLEYPDITFNFWHEIHNQSENVTSLTTVSHGAVRVVRQTDNPNDHDVPPEIRARHALNTIEDIWIEEAITPQRIDAIRAGILVSDSGERIEYALTR